MEQLSTSVDCVIFGFDDAELKVLLIKRNIEPQRNMMALPGDFIDVNESIDEAANRTLKSITNIDNLYLEQIRAFGNTNRFPISRVITVGYYALVNIQHYQIKAGHTAETLEWCSVNNIPPLVFDHREIVDAGLAILKRKVRREPLGFNLLPENFSLTELQQVYEAILGTPLNKRNFRTKINQMKLLIDTGIKQEKVAHKPAKLYRFDEAIYNGLVEEGFYFKL